MTVRVVAVVALSGVANSCLSLNQEAPRPLSKNRKSVPLKLYDTPDASSKQLRDVAFQRFGDLILRHRADDLLDDLPVLEYEQRGNSADVELRRRCRIVVDIELGDADLVFVLIGDLIEDGRDHLARTAPFGPEIEQYGLFVLEHVFIESRVACVNDAWVTH